MGYFDHCVTLPQLTLTFLNLPLEKRIKPPKLAFIPGVLGEKGSFKEHFQI